MDREEERLEPIEGFLAVLDEGRTTATSKFGLLLALLDLAPEVGPAGEITLQALAQRQVALQWDHPLPFGHTSCGRSPLATGTTRP